jgi:hypothetical protein
MSNLFIWIYSVGGGREFHDTFQGGRKPYKFGDHCYINYRFVIYILCTYVMTLNTYWDVEWLGKKYGERREGNKCTKYIKNDKWGEQGR